MEAQFGHQLTRVLTYQRAPLRVVTEVRPLNCGAGGVVPVAGLRPVCAGRSWERLEHRELWQDRCLERANFLRVGVDGSQTGREVLGADEWGSWEIEAVCFL